MAGMEPQRRRSANVWIGLFDRLVARWRFALGARRALGAEPVEAIVGDVPTTPEVPAARSEAASQVAPAQVHGFHRPVLVLNPRSGSARAVREQLLEAAGRYGIQLDEAATPAGLVGLARQAVADGADVLGVAGGDGSLAAVAAVAIEAELPFVCVPAGTRNHFAGDLGLDRADPAAAIEAFVAGSERRVDVATVGERLFLNNASIGIYAALVHEPSYRDDWLGAVSGVLENMLERDVLPVQVSFCDGSGNPWDQVLILFVSNNPYPLTGLGGRRVWTRACWRCRRCAGPKGRSSAAPSRTCSTAATRPDTAGRAGRRPALRSTHPAAGWRSASTASRRFSTPRSSSRSTRARCVCCSLHPGRHPGSRQGPGPRHRAAERWPSPRPSKGASSRSQGWCGLAACSAGSVNASSGPSGTSAVGR
jgi:hypothetical protein